MFITDIKRNTGTTIGHIGLAFIAEMARISGLDRLVGRLSPVQMPQIKEHEIFRTLAGLISQGKTDFDHVREYSDNDFFATSLGLRRIPSSEILRQRFQSIALKSDIEAHLPQCSVELWNRAGMRPEYIEITDKDTKRTWVRLDIDVSIFDNGDTKKEGASPTYDKRFGFAPIFSHLGGGWLVNAKLRPGSSHSSCAGTDEFILESVGYARGMVREPILAIADSGFDSQERVCVLMDQPNTDFIIKHNLRRESVEGWLALAEEHAEVVEQYTAGKERGEIYRGVITREIGAKENRREVRQVFEVTKVRSKNGVYLLEPDIRVCVLWTSLALPFSEVLRLYRERGTSEQYHGEFKTELDMERLPSGKFAVNSTFLRLGMLVYNMLRVVGDDLVTARMLGLKNATRRRTKTVMRCVMDICGRITHHARRTILHVACSPPWYEVICGLFQRLKTA